MGPLLVPRARSRAHVRRPGPATSNGSVGLAPAGVPSDQGNARRARSAAARYRAPEQAELPPFHGGIVGWMGYDTVREIERLPDVPHDDLGFPDAVCSLAGQVAAFDHFRQRCLPDRERVPAAGLRRSRAARRSTTARSAKLAVAVADLGRPLPYTPALPPPDELTELPEVVTNQNGSAVDRSRRSREGTHPRRRHLPGRARAAFRSGRARRSVRGLPRVAAREPVAVHVLPAPPGGDDRRFVTGADGASARRTA